MVKEMGVEGNQEREAGEIKLATMILKKRITGGYKYVKCECGKEIEVSKPIELKMPYCSSCGKIVLDAAQIYCCWCGEKFE